MTRWATILVTVLLSLVNGQSQHHVQTARIDTSEGIEHIRVDPDRELEEIYLPAKKIRILNDFKLGIAVYRIGAKGRSACFLQTLNKTEILPPKTMARYIKAGGYLQSDAKGNSKTIRIDLIAAKNKVKDISFLNGRARAICQDLPTHWLLPLDKAGRRPKRWIFLMFTFVTTTISFVTAIIRVSAAG